MGQRSKAMDTESPTSKFLYAVIKQLDLKLVDWNAVARDLGISNGHAARMRYSRFKGQIDPSTAQRNAKKKNPKKGEKGDPKCDISIQTQLEMPMSLPPQIPFQLVNTGLLPKAEHMESPCQPNPFVKCEPGSYHGPGDQNLPDGPEAQHHLPHMMPASSMAPPPQVSQYVPHGLPFSMAPAMSSSMPLSSPSPFGLFQPMPMSQDLSMQPPIFSNAPMITWEPPVPPPCEDTPVGTPPAGEFTPVMVKEEPDIVERKSDIEAPIKAESGQQEW